MAERLLWFPPDGETKFVDRYHAKLGPVTSRVTRFHAPPTEGMLVRLEARFGFLEGALPRPTPAPELRYVGFVRPRGLTPFVPTPLAAMKLELNPRMAPHEWRFASAERIAAALDEAEALDERP